MDISAYSDKVILAIGAHPDDVEFGCGATMAALAQAGATTCMAVATDGNRGSRHHEVEKSALVSNRQAETRAAAEILGASQVLFLEEEDGNLIADIGFKEKVVRLIRQIKPDVVFTHDPSWFYRINDDGTSWVNHTDHRACGSAVLDAVYPLARDLQSFPDHIGQGLLSHTVPELYLYGNREGANCFVDISATIEAKIASIAAHKSQIDDPDATGEYMRNNHRKTAEGRGMDYAEGFVRLAFD